MDEEYANLLNAYDSGDHAELAMALLQPRVSLLTVGILALIFGPVYLFCSWRLQAWLKSRPWWNTNWTLMQNSLTTMGFSKEEAVYDVCVQSFCYFTLFSSYHFICACAILPVVIYGWEDFGLGQFLFAVGILMDVALTVYDEIVLIIRYFFPTRCTFLAAKTTKSQIILGAVLHHPLIILMSMPMLWYYPSLRAFHIIATTMLLSASLAIAIMNYKMSLNLKTNACDIVQFKVLTVFVFGVIFAFRGFTWFYEVGKVLILFHKDGQTLFFVAGCITSFLMSGFNALILFDGASSVKKHVLCPRKEGLLDDDTESQS